MRCVTSKLKCGSRSNYGRKLKRSRHKLKRSKYEAESNETCTSFVYDSLILETAGNTSAGQQMQPVDLP